MGASVACQRISNLATGHYLPSLSSPGNDSITFFLHSYNDTLNYHQKSYLIVSCHSIRFAKEELQVASTVRSSV